MSTETQPRNGTGFPTGWAGTWGPMSDGRSRLARLAVEIECEILEELLGRRVRRSQRRRAHAKLPRLVARDIGQAARLRALAVKAVASIGHEPKASPRMAAGVQARADTLLESVRGRAAVAGRGLATNDLAAALRQATRRAGQRGDG